jgi:hypothetical protein
MVLGYTIPYGVRQIQITPYTTGETLASTSLKLPAARSLSFSEAEDFEELRGDDGVITVRGKGPGVDWDMEGGGLDLSVAASMFGGAVTLSATTPNQINTLRKLGTDVRPFFKLEGRAISDSGGDFHAVLWKCRCTDKLDFSLEDGKFTLFGAKGQAIPRQTSITGPPVVPANILYDLVQNETAVAIP